MFFASFGRTSRPTYCIGIPDPGILSARVL
jgi:hypothetical protein